MARLVANTYIQLVYVIQWLTVVYRTNSTSAINPLYHSLAVGLYDNTTAT